jgi:TATA-box binding protein (TBP) (component of TFIID and TFIIIB)
MEKEDYEFKVTNLKISVKLLQSVSLKFVEDRCKLLQPIHKNIAWRRYGNNFMTLRYKTFTYTLFKKSSKKDLPQHCNITRIRSEPDIPEAIGHLFFLVNQSPVWLDYTIDNISCSANTNQEIDIVGIYMNELKIACDYNQLIFPALKIYCPKRLIEKSKKICSLVYRSGSVILVGGRCLNEIKEFFYWVLKITREYPRL